MILKQSHYTPRDHVFIELLHGAGMYCISFPGRERGGAGRPLERAPGEEVGDGGRHCRRPRQ